MKIIKSQDFSHLKSVCRYNEILYRTTYVLATARLKHLPRLRLRIAVNAELICGQMRAR